MLDVQGGRGLPNSDNDGQGEGGKGGKKSNILTDVLCEWPLTRKIWLQKKRSSR